MSDWYATTNVSLFTDQTCVSELFFVNKTFYTTAQDYTNYSMFDGMLGLSRALTTFTNQMKDTIIGSRVFTISYDPENIFTFEESMRDTLQRNKLELLMIVYKIEWAKTFTYQD